VNRKCEGKRKRVMALKLSLGNSAHHRCSTGTSRDVFVLRAYETPVWL
jgi:hypothetical protein